MKSITKKLSLLLILSATLFLSSCLESGNNSYIGNEEYSYITQSQTTGTVYARTLAGYSITSPKIQQLPVRSTAFLSYQVTEESETVALDDNLIAYKVNLGAEPVSIDQTNLLDGEAVNDPTLKFESIMEPLFARNEYFGDFWLFPYTYKIKKGESVRVTFHKAELEESDNNSDFIIIDVRLSKVGTPEDNASLDIKGNYIAVNMSRLRLLGINDADANGNLNIKFRYYRSEYEDLFTTNKVYTMLIDKDKD